MTHYRTASTTPPHELFTEHCAECNGRTQHICILLENGLIQDTPNIRQSDIPHIKRYGAIARNQCSVCGCVSYDYVVPDYQHKRLRFHRIWPQTFKLETPAPNTDLPEHILHTYQEAALVFPHSPRAAAALLRYALQQILQDLRIPGNSINEQIAALHKEGVDPRLISLMDTCRVIGNNAAHTGEIIFSDTPSIARTLFLFINEIAARTYTLQRARNEIAAQIPEDMVQLINKRQQK